jgi:hypothetical protein
MAEAGRSVKEYEDTQAELILDSRWSFAHHFCHSCRLHTQPLLHLPSFGSSSPIVSGFDMDTPRSICVWGRLYTRRTDCELTRQKTLGEADVKTEPGRPANSSQHSTFEVTFAWPAPAELSRSMPAVLL